MQKEEKISVALVVVLGLLSAFGPLSLDMYLPGLPELAKDMSVGTSLAQLSLTACMIGLALGQLVIGAVSDAVGRRKPLIIGVTAYFIVSLICVFQTNIYAFLVLRFIQGFAGGAGSVLSRAVARDHYDGKMLTRFFGFLMLINGLGPILAPIIGGGMLLFTNWRGIFILLTIIGFLLLILSFFYVKESLPLSARQTNGLKGTFTSFFELSKSAVFMQYALPQGLLSGMMFAYIAASPFVLQEIYQLSPQQFSICFAVNGIGLVIASQLAGSLSIRYNESSLYEIGIGIAFFASLILLIELVSGASVIWILVALFVAISSTGLVNTVGTSLAMQSQASHAGSASALIGLFSFLFGGIVSPLVGLGSGTTGAPMGIVMFACSFLALLLYMIYRKGRMRHEN
ncbi:drug resistance transporter, Bcr/CflA subfamily protein [Listeria floridensis FSL S10-1187]|uniref:Bcr/CflA family efflux transporter n=1 Tax=Listeria floridensis FSL S10-1187 TaxID=1265817 RepID=A0ABP3AZW2_9LIST|nr:multidrug effflux MFS transporter [Listeria floridensis]EUJ33183.1 drug resistance transporter, Bcr/CflA subfamily protein [Listeria floridensis FSL S10-1187]